MFQWWVADALGQKSRTLLGCPDPESACDTPVMSDFEVAYSNGVLTTYSGDGARYEINPQSGVLTVFDGDGKRFHFSPAGWLSVRDEAPVSVYETHGGKSV